MHENANAKKSPITLTKIVESKWQENMINGQSSHQIRKLPDLRELHPQSDAGQTNKKTNQKLYSPILSYAGNEKPQICERFEILFS